MIARERSSYDLRHLANRRPDAPELDEALRRAAGALSLSPHWCTELRAGLPKTLEELADTGAPTLQAAFARSEVAAALTSGRMLRAPAGWWATARLLILTRAVVASWPVLRRVRMRSLLEPLPAEDPLAVAYRRLCEARDEIGRISPHARRRAPDHAMRLMLARGYARLEQITEDDLMATDWGPDANVDRSTHCCAI